MLLKLESNREYDLSIAFMLTFRCNYDCSYCESHDVNHPLNNKPAKSISDALNYVTSFYQNKSIIVNILGGEPFLYKNIFNIFNNLEERIDVKVTTNLSFTLDFIKKTFNNTKINIKASFHPEYADPYEFVKKVKYLQQNNFNITSNISMHPNESHFEKAIYILENLPRAKPHILSNMNVNGLIFGDSFSYSPSQIKTIKKYSGSLKKYIKCTYSDNIKYVTHQDLISNNLDNFKGMKCYAGHENLHIKENGDIFPAACFLNTKTSLGNMYKKTFRVPKSYVLCPFTSCKCVTDLNITKEVQK